MKRFRFYSIVFLATTLCLSSCAYKLGVSERQIPENLKKISIPVMKNLSREVGAEIYFTNALIQEFERSKVAEVLPESLSDAVLRGTISRIEYVAPETGMKLAKDSEFLPQGTVLATIYNINVVIDMSLVRRSDEKVIWSGSFSGVRSYSAPQVTLPVVNSVNPLYNLSARRQNIELIANDVMSEVHDRMTENF